MVSLSPGVRPSKSGLSGDAANVDSMVEPNREPSAAERSFQVLRERLQGAHGLPQAIAHALLLDLEEGEPEALAHFTTALREQGDNAVDHRN